MESQGYSWLYYLVDEFGNSYQPGQGTGEPPPPDPNKYINQISNQVTGLTIATLKRTIKWQIGPTVTPGDVYRIIIGPQLPGVFVGVKYTVQVGDNATAVRDALVNLLNTNGPFGLFFTTGSAESTNIVVVEFSKITVSATADIIAVLVDGDPDVVQGLVALQFTPDGWQDISIAWERNLDDYGNVRNFSLPLKFVLEGADILRHLVYTTNFEKKVYLLIQKQVLDTTLTTYNYRYQDYYRGEIDLTTFNDEESTVTVNIMEGDLHKLLKADRNTTYEIPCDEITIYHDGVELEQKGNFGVIDQLPIQKSVYGPQFFLPVFFINTDGNSTGVFFKTQDLEDVSALTFPDKLDSDNYFALADVDNNNPITFNITISIKFICTSNSGNSGFRMRFLTNSLTIPTQNLYEFYSTGVSMVVGQTYNIVTDIPVTLLPGEKLHLEGIYFAGGSGETTIEFLEPSTIIAKYVNQYRPSKIKGIKPFTLFQRLIEKICGQPTYAQSQLLQDYEHLIVTCGDAVRGFENPKIKTSLDDFFKSFNSILCAGIGIVNGKVVFEERMYFYDVTSPIVLGEIKDLKIKLATQLIFNTVKIGYDGITYDDVNGRYEFNTTQLYTTPVHRITKELNLVSKYRADCYGIEHLRINHAGRDTTDDSDDNTVFIINTDLTTQNPDGTYNIYRKVYTAITGVPYPNTIYNIEDLTPKRMLKRHIQWISSVLYGFDGNVLNFETITKNRSLFTNDNGDIVDEDADEPILNTGYQVKPFIFEFGTQAPLDLVEVLEANPNRCFQFIHPNGETFKGFNIRIGISPDSLEEKIYELLSTGDNDITKLKDNG